MGLAADLVEIHPSFSEPLSEEELADWYEIRPTDPLHPVICQSIEEGMALVTPDPLIQRYPVKTVWD